MSKDKPKVAAKVLEKLSDKREREESEQREVFLWGRAGQGHMEPPRQHIIRKRPRHTTVECLLGSGRMGRFQHIHC